MLDAPLRAPDKIALAQGLGDQLSEEQRPGARPAPGLRRAAARRRRTAPPPAKLERDLDAQLERAATRAFRNSFLIGAGLALAALLALIPRRAGA